MGHSRDARCLLACLLAVLCSVACHRSCILYQMPLAVLDRLSVYTGVGLFGTAVMAHMSASL